MGDFINFSTPHLCSGRGSKNCGCLFQISHRIPSQSCPTSLCMAEVHRNLCSHIIIFQIIFHEHVFCLISVRHVKIVLKNEKLCSFTCLLLVIFIIINRLVTFSSFVANLRWQQKAVVEVIKILLFLFFFSYRSYYFSGK